MSFQPSDWWKHAFEKGIYPLSVLMQDPQWRKKTLREVSFIRRVLRLSKGSKVLDVGCGAARHALELAARGQDVTGIDISAHYLAQAQRRAQERKARLRLLRKDMRALDFEGEFDAAINLFTSFGYFAHPGDDLRVLKGVRRALKPGGLLLLEVVNGTHLTGLFKAAAAQGLRSKNWEQLPDGSLMLEDPKLLPKQGVVRTHWVFLSKGARSEMVSYIRMFSRAALSGLCRKAGLRVIRVFGDMHGARYEPAESPRLVLLAQRPGTRGTR